MTDLTPFSAPALCHSLSCGDDLAVSRLEVEPCTHLYTPGIRRHINGALAEGATIEEIIEVLKLCGTQGVDACELGAPILAEELENHTDDRTF